MISSNDNLSLNTRVERLLSKMEEIRYHYKYSQYVYRLVDDFKFYARKVW